MHFAVVVVKKSIWIFLNGHLVHAINDSDYAYQPTWENPLFIQLQSVDWVMTPLSLYSDALSDLDVSLINKLGLMSS